MTVMRRLNECTITPSIDDAHRVPVAAAKLSAVDVVDDRVGQLGASFRLRRPVLRSIVDPQVIWDG
jgi:hypothetical protein